MKTLEIVLNPTQVKTLVVGDAIFRSRFDYLLTESDLEQARLELGETERTKEISLRKLKEMLSNDKNFNYRSEDKYLLRFLRLRKYDTEKAYNTIRKFYILRKERPDLFSLKSNLESILNRDASSCLPYRNEEGCMILWGDSNKWKLEEMTFWEALSGAIAFLDVISTNPSCQVNGVILLFDFGGVTVRHLAQYAYPSVLRIGFKCMQDAVPWRIKRIIALNCNSIVLGVYYAFRYLLNKKMRERLVLFGSDLSELPQYLNPRLLPKKYGGSIDRSECSVTRFVLDNIPYIQYERSFGAVGNS